MAEAAMVMSVGAMALSVVALMVALWGNGSFSAGRSARGRYGRAGRTAQARKSSLADAPAEYQSTRVVPRDKG